MIPCTSCLKKKKDSIGSNCALEPEAMELIKMEQSILTACESVVARPEAMLMQVPVEVMKLCSKSAQFM